MILRKRPINLSVKHHDSAPDAIEYHLSQESKGRVCAGRLLFTDEMLKYAIGARSIIASSIADLRKDIRQKILNESLH